MSAAPSGLIPYRRIGKLEYLAVEDQQPREGRHSVSLGQLGQLLVNRPRRVGSRSPTILSYTLRGGREGRVTSGRAR
jgi:hypothetical protein